VLRALAAAVLIFVPLFASIAAYKSWNEMRTGHPIVTTSYQLVLMYPLIRAYRYDPSIFAGESDFDRVARASISRYRYEDGIEINQTLHSRYKWNGIALAREVESRYWRAWRTNFVAMLRATADRMRFADATILVQPVGTLNMILSWAKVTEWNALSTTTLARNVFAQGNVGYLPLLFFDLAGKIASVAIVIALALGAVQALRHWPSSRSRPLILEFMAMGAIIAGFYGAHAIVRIDHRYLMPLLPVAFIMASVLYRQRDILFLSAPSTPNNFTE